MTRHFVVGDIHGCHAQLFAQLQHIGFDFNNDKLHALGDLIDRGPESQLCLELIKQPWFDSIMGNHEEMLVDGHRHIHMINGGEWFYELDYTTRETLRDLALTLPVYRTIKTETKTYGLVHADVWSTDWRSFTDHAHTDEVKEHALWSRRRVREPNPAPIRNIDHVYFGHTPLSQPRHHANMSWIDTGCFATGKLTIEELI